MSDTIIEKKEHPMALMLEFSTNMIANILRRIKVQKDPVIKYTLLLDKFILILEIIQSIPIISQIPPELQTKMKAVSVELQNELDEFNEYIRLPHLNPDHPVGRQEMINGSLLFEEKKTQLNGYNGTGSNLW